MSKRKKKEVQEAQVLEEENQEGELEGDTRQVVDELFEKLHNTDVGKDKLSRQEENWLMMTLLQIPWHNAERVDKPEDRKFLLERAEQIKKMAILAQQQEQEQQRRMMQEQHEQMTSGEGSQILTPQDFMPPR